MAEKVSGFYGPLIQERYIETYMHGPSPLKSQRSKQIPKTEMREILDWWVNTPFPVTFIKDWKLSCYYIWSAGLRPCLKCILGHLAGYPELLWIHINKQYTPDLGNLENSFFF